MLLTAEEQQRLNAVFDALWHRGGGVRGAVQHNDSWYIHRGGLLLHGTSRFGGLEVLIPVGSAVIYTAGCDLPKIGGEAVTVFPDNDGPWWDLLCQELPLMEAELEAAKAAKIATRVAELQRAAASLAPKEE